jgi:hypothetical protein
LTKGLFEHLKLRPASQSPCLSPWYVVQIIE